MNCNCCFNKGKKSYLYNIDDLLDCNVQYNFYLIPCDIINKFKEFKIYDFLSNEFIDNIKNFLMYKWKNIINTIKSFFRNRDFITYNLEILQNDIFNLLISYWTDLYEDIIKYYNIINPNIFQENRGNITIHSVNDEPERTQINNTFDFMKTNIQSQDATDFKEKSLNLGDTWLKLIENKNYLFAELQNDLIIILKNKLNIYIPQIHGFICERIVNNDK